MGNFAHEKCGRRSFPVALAVWLVCGIAVGDDDTRGIAATEPIPIAGGNLVVCWKTPDADSVLLHFHGAVETVRQAYRASRFEGVLVVVNFPGLSRAYSTPVANNPELFDWVLNRAWENSRSVTENAGPAEWDQVNLSCFSAGYGAVREILKTGSNFKRIDALITADSIYAGLDPESEARAVKPEHMRDFLRFARSAADEKKRFTLSHSSQPTPYASTTETADYLRSALGIERESSSKLIRPGMEQQTRAADGRFLILGFAGTSGKAHMQHLHNIDLLWDLCLFDEQ